ncbi:MAG: hypothetical protein VB111_12985 [Clostridiaceae bacterium]|nr:hypothetical protein [Clostridiaceae bacterium]
MYNGRAPGRNIAESEDGFYITAGNYLYFLDLTQGKALPLCSKPNCLHAQEAAAPEACNAYFFPFDSVGAPVFYTDGKLYVFTYTAASPFGKRQLALTEVSADGAARKDLYTFSTSELGASSRMLVHRGCFYVVLRQMTETDVSYSVWQYPLDKKGEPKCLLSSADVPDYINFDHIYAADDYLYFLADLTASSEPVSLRLSIPDRTLERLYNIGDAGHWISETRVYGDTLFNIVIALERQTSDVDGYVQRQGESEPSFWGTLPLGQIVADDLYVYQLDLYYDTAASRKSLRIYTQTGALLMEYPVEDEIPDYRNLYVGKEQVLLSAKDNSAYWYFDKSDIPSGIPQWKRIVLE